MLQLLRNSTRHPIAKVFLGLVVLSFAVLGLGSFLPSMQLKRDFITSGKTSIEIQEIASEFNKMRARLAPNMSINEAIEAGLLDSLIAYLSNEAILLEEARINGLVATREQQKIELLKTEAFHDDKGDFSSSKFQTALLRAGLTEQRYLELLDRGLIKTQLTKSISNAAFVPNAVINQIAAHALEKRSGTVITLEIPDPSSIDKPSEKKLKDFFDNSSKSWLEPPRRVAKFITLDPKEYLNDISLEEEDLKKEFELRKSDYDQEERRSIRQLIFDTKEEAFLAKNRIINGETFDTISSQENLGTNTLIKDITKRQLPNDFAVEVFNSVINQLTGPIKSDFGFHVFKVEEISPFSAAVYEKVKDNLLKDVKLDRATDLIYDLANFADDEFSSGSSIDDVAKAKNLKVFRTKPLDKNGLDENKSV